jgi:hypothetical protein
MVLEWIRRRDPAFDEKLRTYLFTEGSIVGREAVAEGKAAGDAAAGASANGRAATIGSLRGGR